MKRFTGMTRHAALAVLTAAMAASMCPTTAFAVTGSEVAADGTYTASESVVYNQTAIDDEADWATYDVNVSVTVTDGKISNITASGAPDESSTYFNKAYNKTKGIKTLLEGKSATADTVEAWDTVGGATCTSNALKSAVASALGSAEKVKEYVYVNMNIPYSDFYKNMNIDGSVDTVTGATSKKIAGCQNVYTNSDGPTIADGMDLDGVVMPVRLEKDTYDSLAGKITDATADYYMSDVLLEIPSVYMDCTYTSNFRGGSYSFTLSGQTTTTDDVEAKLTSDTNWGDYELDLTNSTDYGVESSKVYGAYLTTDDGTVYPMLQSENLWNPTTYSEFGWSTGVKETDMHDAPYQYEAYESMEGKTIASATFITSEGIKQYNLKAAEGSSLAVAKHFDSVVQAVLTTDKLTLYGIPSDAENVTVKMVASGKGGATIITAGKIADDGSVAFDDGESVAAGTTYKITVSSDNYAAYGLSAVPSDDVYVMMNVPYTDFYTGAANNNGIDTVTGATTQKIAGCSNVYSSGATIEGGMDLNGVVMPVKFSAADFAKIAGKVTGEDADYYLGKTIASEPSVFLSATVTEKSMRGQTSYSYSFTLKGATTETNDVSASVTSNTNWGDYELDLNSKMGVASKDVYGAYLTTDDGKNYPMLQSENLWAPSSYYEFGWSTGVKETDIHGAPFQYAAYEDMEGKTITSVTFITKNGLYKYNLTAEAGESLLVEKHFDSVVQAALTDANTLKLFNIPSDAINVTVTAAASGKGGATLANAVALAADGTVALSSAAESGKTYKVTINSDNYATYGTSVTLTDGSIYVMMNVPYGEFYSALNKDSKDAAIDTVTSATSTKAGEAQNVYFGAADADYSDGITIRGIVVPVKFDADTFAKVSGLVTDKTADNYIGKTVVSAPSVYLNGSYDADKKEYTFTYAGEVKETSDVEATFKTSTNYGDYELDLSDSDLSVDASVVYGAYLTAKDGTQYPLLQSENLWRPASFNSFAWSTGVNTMAKGMCPLQADSYKSMEGKYLTNVTFITKNGILQYNLKDELYVAPHYSGTVSAEFTSGTKVSLKDLPSDAENVKVKVAAGGKGGATLVSDAEVSDGVVTIEKAGTLGTTYTVTVSSSNYADITTTAVYDKVDLTSLKIEGVNTYNYAKVDSASIGMVKAFVTDSKSYEVTEMTNIAGTDIFYVAESTVDDTLYGFDPDSTTALVDTVTSATSFKSNHAKDIPAIIARGKDSEGHTTLTGYMAQTSAKTTDYVEAAIIKAVDTDNTITLTDAQQKAYKMVLRTVPTEVFASGQKVELSSASYSYSCNYGTGEFVIVPDNTVKGYVWNEYLENIYKVEISDGTNTATAVPWIDYYGESATEGYHYNKLEIAVNNGESVGSNLAEVTRFKDFYDENNNFKGGTYTVTVYAQGYDNLVAKDIVVKPTYTGKAEAEFTDNKTLKVSGIDDLNDAKVTVSVTTGQGRGATTTYLVKEASVKDGAVALDDAAVNGTKYTVTIDSDNYAPVTTTAKFGLDLDAAQESLASAKALDSSKYTADSYKPVKAAITALEDAISACQSQQSVDDAKAALDAAVKALVKKADTSKASAAITAAKKLDSSKYTDATYKAVTDAIAAAEKVVAKDDATQAEVDAATKALNDAVAALEKKPEETKAPETEETKAPETEAAETYTEAQQALRQMVLLKVKAGSKKNTLSWKAVPGAVKYSVYYANGGKSSKYKSVTTTKTSWTNKSLKKGKDYKYYVVAYGSDGKKICRSYVMHSYTTGGKKTNVKAVSVKKASVTLKVKKTSTIKASVTKVKKSGKLVNNVAKFRYFTTNKKVATVSKKGKITAKGKGTCTIYVVANNGQYKAVKVTVK